MAGKDNKKLKNLFFYGISFVNYDSTDVTLDIITNIRKRFLVTKKPASNKLYRFANGESFIYSYNFSFERPLQWRVLRNKSVVEEIESLLSGKYCINLYDEQGKDLKKTFFDSHHKWFKTNYYSPVSNEDLVCSLVPKVFEDETSLLKYMTGEVYPERLHPCTIPSCEEVRDRVLSKIPTPLVTALTNYGIVYFMPEDDKKNYEYVLAEEEEVYKKENAPEVFVTAEDVESGFNLSVRDFDMSKNLNRTFDISLAAEFDSENHDAPVVYEVKTEPQKPAESVVTTTDDGSVNAAITGIVEQINALTSLDIDAKRILGSDLVSKDNTGEEALANEDYISFDDEDFGIDEQLKHIDSVLDDSSLLTAERKLVIGENIVDDDYISSIIDGIISSAFSSDEDEETDTEAESSEEAETEVIITKEAEVNEAEVIEEKVAEAEVSEADVAENYIEEIIFVGESADPELVAEEEASAEAFEEVTDEITSEPENIAEETSEIDSEMLASEDTVVPEESSDETTKDLSDNEINTEAAVDALVEEILSKLSAADQYIKDNPADVTIESRGEIYSYYGSVDENGKRSGRGRTLMSDGSIAYEGEYKDDKRKGQGSFYFKDGSLCYWGNWDNNVREGFGVGVSSDDKAVHVGNWTSNKPAGTGARFDAEGNLMFVSSNCDDKKKGFTISDLSNESFTIRVWSEKDDAYIQREININDIIK